MLSRDQYGEFAQLLAKLLVAEIDEQPTTVVEHLGTLASLASSDTDDEASATHWFACWWFARGAASLMTQIPDGLLVSSADLPDVTRDAAESAAAFIRAAQTGDEAGAMGLHKVMDLKDSALMFIALLKITGRLGRVVEANQRDQR